MSVMIMKGEQLSQIIQLIVIGQSFKKYLPSVGELSLLIVGVLSQVRNVQKKFWKTGVEQLSRAE